MNKKIISIIFLLQVFYCHAGITDLLGQAFGSALGFIMPEFHVASIPKVNVKVNMQSGRLVPGEFIGLGVAPPPPAYYIPPIMQPKVHLHRGSPAVSIQCQCTPQSNCMQEIGYKCGADDKVIMLQAQPGDIICCPIDKLIC